VATSLADLVDICGDDSNPGFGLPAKPVPTLELKVGQWRARKAGVAAVVIAFKTVWHANRLSMELHIVLCHLCETVVRELTQKLEPHEYHRECAAHPIDATMSLAVQQNVFDVHSPTTCLIRSGFSFARTRAGARAVRALQGIGRDLRHRQALAARRSEGPSLRAACACTAHNREAAGDRPRAPTSEC
jgi:hypothetical protein